MFSFPNANGEVVGPDITLLRGTVILVHTPVTERPHNVAPGETFLVTEEGCERLGRMPLVPALGAGG